MIITITNLKGGVGKTTLATNLAVAFKKRGHKVCLADADVGQKSASEWAACRDESLPSVPVFGVTEKQIDKQVRELAQNYDFVFIDGKPSLTEGTDRAVIVSDLVLVPLLPSLYDFRSFETFFESIDFFRKRRAAVGEKMAIAVVLNRVTANSTADKNIIEPLADYDATLLKTRLGNRVSYANSVIKGMGVVEFTDAKARAEMEALCDEIETLVRSIS